MKIDVSIKSNHKSRVVYIFFVLMNKWRVVLMNNQWSIMLENYWCYCPPINLIARVSNLMELRKYTIKTIISIQFISSFSHSGCTPWDALESWCFARKKKQNLLQTVRVYLISNYSILIGVYFISYYSFLIRVYSVGYTRTQKWLAKHCAILTIISYIFHSASRKVECPQPYDIHLGG